VLGGTAHKRSSPTGADGEPQRRQVPGVVVQNAGQINVGQQQLNVSAGHGPATTPAATIP
jgi:hypothetical protein